jgi:hypothetical protein
MLRVLGSYSRNLGVAVLFIAFACRLQVVPSAAQQHHGTVFYLQSFWVLRLQLRQQLYERLRSLVLVESAALLAAPLPHIARQIGSRSSAGAAR